MEFIFGYFLMLWFQFWMVFPSHDSEFCTIKVYLILDVFWLLRDWLITISGLLQCRLHHGEDEEAPDEAEYDRAGEQEVENGDLQFSNIEREYWVVWLPRSQIGITDCFIKKGKTYTWNWVPYSRISLSSLRCGLAPNKFPLYLP